MSQLLPVRRHIQDTTDDCGPAVAQMIVAFLANALHQQPTLVSGISSWKMTNPQINQCYATWATPPPALAQVLTGAIQSIAYEVAPQLTAAQIIARIDAGLSSGLPSALLLAGDSHWVVVVGKLAPSADGKHRYKCIDPLPSLVQLTSSGGFVTACRNGASDPVCPLVQSAVPPHKLDDWCDDIDGDDMLPATWSLNAHEQNQIVKVPDPDVAGDPNPLGMRLNFTVLPVNSLLRRFPAAFWVWLGLPTIRDFWRLLRWRRAPVPRPTPRSAQEWEAAARHELQNMQILPTDRPTRGSEQWTVRELKKGNESALRIVAVLDQQIDRGWLVLFQESTGAFVLARKAAPPIMRALRASGGRDLWWSRSDQGMSPVYPFVWVGSRLLRLIDGRVFEPAEVELL